MSNVSNQGVIKTLAVGRSDVYRMNPFDLHVKEDWNCRVVNFDPKDPEDLAMAYSIAEVGVKQPLTVYTEDGKAYISDGHRRHGATMYAIKELGAEVRSVPVQTEDRYASEADRVFSQIVRNSGKPLAPIEQAGVFKRLIDLGWTEKDIAKKTGMTRAWIVELLELRAAPDSITRLVASGQVTATLAIATLKKAGDSTKAAAELSRAVDRAAEQGKTRATAKHMNTEKPPSLKERLKAIFESAEFLPSSNGYIIEVTADQYATLRSALDL